MRFFALQERHAALMGVKIGVEELWRFKIGVLSLKFSAPSTGETVRRIRKCFRGAGMVLTSFFTMPSLVGQELGLHTLPGGERGAKSLMFFCPSHMKIVCERHFAIKALDVTNDLDIVR